MSEEQHILDPTRFYYIDTKTPSNPNGRTDFEFVDLTASPTYQKLLKAEKDRTLADLFPRMDVRLASKARNFHNDDMLKEEGVKKFVSIQEGLIPIPKENKADAIKALQLLQQIDKDIKMWDFSSKLDEEDPKAKKK